MHVVMMCVCIYMYICKLNICLYIYDDDFTNPRVYLTYLSYWKTVLTNNTLNLVSLNLDVNTRSLVAMLANKKMSEQTLN